MRTGALVAALVALVVAVRLLWLTAPVSSDEGGYLMVAGQWRPGTSLYGSYWVDRPPLLIWVYDLADLLGGKVGLRLLGCVLAASVVLLAHALGRAVAGPGRASLWVAGAAAAFVSTPLFGVVEVDGELIAAPLVLAGVLAAIRATTAAGGSVRTRRWFLAGALGASAFLVKQSFLDVLVFGLVLILATARARSESRRRLARDLCAFAVGAALLVVVIVGLAALRGTDPSALWNAMVTFRLQAAAVVDSSSSGATAARFARYPGVLLVSGALVPPAALVVRLVKGPRSPLVHATVALVSWELLAVLAGASYWLHYLIGLIPGISLATALTVTQWGPTARTVRAVRFGVGYAAVATALAVVVLLPSTLRPSDEQIVGDWLGASARRTDTAVVLYGQPGILQTAGLQSPYQELWSLPMRVRDPRLTALARILDGPHAPAWMLVEGTLKTWAIHPGAVRAALGTHYTPAARICGFHVYLRDRLHRFLQAPPTACDPSRIFT